MASMHEASGESDIVVYDPEIDIDWKAGPVDGLPYHPDRLVSLYGTKLWAALSPRQRAVLARSEAADIVGFSFVAKTLVAHLMLRVAQGEDQDSARLRRTLAELGDGSRHLIMLGRVLESIGASQRTLGPRWVRRLVPLAELMQPRPLTWATSLLVNEPLLGLHRELAEDVRVQPLIRMVARIHLAEESRHVSHARGELLRTIGAASPAEVAITQVVVAAGALVTAALRIRPGAYGTIGLLPGLAWLVARTNPVHAASLARQSERLVSTFQEAGLIEGPLLRAIWRRSGLLEAAA